LGDTPLVERLPKVIFDWWRTTCREAARQRSPTNLSLVAADVRRLKLFGRNEIGASLRRLLRFIAPNGSSALRSRFNAPYDLRSGIIA